MVNIKQKRKLKLSILVFLGIFIINYELYPLVSSSFNYTLSSEVGSQIFEVAYYNEEAWKDNINITSNPSDWFGGESDRIGAKSKITVFTRYWGSSSTLGMFMKLFFSWFDVNTSILREYGYDQSYFQNYYHGSYSRWSPQLTSWSFGTEPFDNYSNVKFYDFGSHFLLREPSEFQSILYDYNDFAAVANNDTGLQAINLSMPILSGDDFLWYFVLHRYVLYNPVNNYITEIINAVDCEHVSIQGNKITFTRFGEKAYIMEFAYNSQGILDTVVVKNYDNSLIYKISSSNPKFVVYSIIGISLGAILGLIAFSFYRKRKNSLEVKKFR